MFIHLTPELLVEIGARAPAEQRASGAQKHQGTQTRIGTNFGYNIGYIVRETSREDIEIIDYYLMGGGLPSPAPFLQ
jgi:hypothetical protein